MANYDLIDLFLIFLKKGEFIKPRYSISEKMKALFIIYIHLLLVLLFLSLIQELIKIGHINKTDIPIKPKESKNLNIYSISLLIEPLLICFTYLLCIGKFKIRNIAISGSLLLAICLSTLLNKYHILEYNEIRQYVYIILFAFVLYFLLILIFKNEIIKTRLAKWWNNNPTILIHTSAVFLGLSKLYNSDFSHVPVLVFFSTYIIGITLIFIKGNFGFIYSLALYYFHSLLFFLILIFVI